jgi:hypothetical protein
MWLIVPLCHHHSHSLRRLYARTMVRFAIPLTFINTLATSCQHHPHRSPLCSSRMRSQSRLLSLPGSVVAFCRSLKFTTIANRPVFHPRRSHKLSIDHQSTLPKSQHHFSVNMGTDGRAAIAEIGPFQRSTSVMDATTSNTLYDSGTPASRYSAESEIISGAPVVRSFLIRSFNVSLI